MISSQPLISQLDELPTLIILAYDDGTSTNSEIVGNYNCGIKTVCNWRDRQIVEGISALCEVTRAGVARSVIAQQCVTKPSSVRGELPVQAD